MTHEEAQNSPQTADRVSRALPDATDADEALVQQIAEAMSGISVWVGFRDEAGDDDMSEGTIDSQDLRKLARAVLPLVEAQVAARTADLTRDMDRNWRRWKDAEERNVSLEADLRQANLWSWELKEAADAAEAQVAPLRDEVEHQKRLNDGAVTEWSRLYREAVGVPATEHQQRRMEQVAEQWEQAKAETAALRVEVIALREAARVGIELDNHHNAAMCPYCKPTESAAESALRQVREALARVKRIYEMQCPVGSRDDYMDEGAYFAHQWWQTVLGGELRRADGLLARIGAADKQHEGAGEVTIEQAMWPVVDAYVHAHGNLCPCGLPEAHLLGGKFASRDQGSHARLAAWGGAYPDDKDTPTAGSNGDTAPESGEGR